MSYDIRLVDESGETLTVEEPHNVRGGTYRPGGDYDLALNITYNYAKHFYDVFGPKGIRFLHGKTARETLPVLMDAFLDLWEPPSDDYWAPTAGNAAAAIRGLITLGMLAPEGVWDGD